MTDRRLRTEVFGPTGHPIGVALVEVPEAVPAHGHDFTEIVLVVAGATDYVTESGARTLGPGDVVAVRPGDWHGYTAVAGLAVVNLYLGPELIAAELGWLYDHPQLAGLVLTGGEGATPLAPAAVERVSALARLATDVVVSGAEPQAPRTASRLRLLGLVTSILAELVDLPLRTRPAKPSPLVRAATRRLDADLARAWTVTELAAALRCSGSLLAHRFTAELGLAPMSWLNRARAERLAVGLLSGEQPVAQLGAAVGWPDPNYAARRFRSCYAMSPTAYRARFGASGQAVGQPNATNG